jgi:chromosome segregation ATPase
MWEETKQRQLDELRRRELTGTLTAEERSVLEYLLNELEQDEWQRLGPALRRLHTEQAELRKQCSQLQTQNRLLAALLARQESLLARGRAQLAELHGEHEVLKAEFEQITGQPLTRSP